MTRKLGPVVIIEAEDPQTCSRCGKEKETRPAGPKGERLCFECTTIEERRAYARRLFGESLKS